MNLPRQKGAFSKEDSVNFQNQSIANKMKVKLFFSKKFKFIFVLTSFVNRLLQLIVQL